MKKKYKLLIWGIVLIFIIFLVKTFLNFNNNETGFLGEGYEDYMSVGVYEVKKDNISKYITSSSQITSFNISEITLDDMENVKECYVKDGSSVKKNQKLLKTTIGNYSNRTIKSEISGKFFVIHEDDGNKIYRVYDTTKTGVIVKIKENQINNIKIGEKAIVSLINSDEVYEGKITYALSNGLNIYYYDATNLDGKIDTNNVILGLEYMKDNNIKIINISLSSKKYSSEIESWIKANPQIKVYASYNNLINSFDYPAMYDKVIGVGKKVDIEYKDIDKVYYNNRIIIIPNFFEIFEGNSYLSLYQMIKSK